MELMITYILCFLYIIGISQSFSSNTSNTRKYDKNIMTPRVYNGWAANLGDVPYQISFKRRLSRYDLFASFCGGAIIGPEKLLSAAHCFADKNGICDKIFGGSGTVHTKMLSHIFAVAGQLSNVAKLVYSDGIRTGQWRRLKTVRYPPDYSFPHLDFAIVFLRSPFIFDNYVNSIPYTSRFTDYIGTCLVSGFGRTSPQTTSSKLLLAHLTLLPWKRCNQIHRKTMRHFVCTASQFTDVGKGDSGGPLVCANTGDPNEKDKGVLVGIVSGHAVGVGSFFTRVSSYYKYIERNKSNNENIFCLHIILLLNLLHWRFLLF